MVEGFNTSELQSVLIQLQPVIETLLRKVPREAQEKETDKRNWTTEDDIKLIKMLCSDRNPDAVGRPPIDCIYRMQLIIKKTKKSDTSIMQHAERLKETFKKQIKRLLKEEKSMQEQAARKTAKAAAADAESKRLAMEQEEQRKREQAERQRKEQEEERRREQVEKQREEEETERKQQAEEETKRRKQREAEQAEAERRELESGTIEEQRKRHLDKLRIFTKDMDRRTAFLDTAYVLQEDLALIDAIEQEDKRLVPEDRSSRSLQDRWKTLSDKYLREVESQQEINHFFKVLDREKIGALLTTGGSIYEQHLFDSILKHGLHFDEIAKEFGDKYSVDDLKTKFLHWRAKGSEEQKQLYRKVCDTFGLSKRRFLSHEILDDPIILDAKATDDEATKAERIRVLEQSSKRKVIAPLAQSEQGVQEGEDETEGEGGGHDGQQKPAKKKKRESAENVEMDESEEMEEVQFDSRAQRRALLDARRWTQYESSGMKGMWATKESAAAEEASKQKMKQQAEEDEQQPPQLPIHLQPFTGSEWASRSAAVSQQQMDPNYKRFVRIIFNRLPLFQNKDWDDAEFPRKFSFLLSAKEYPSSTVPCSILRLPAACTYSDFLERVAQRVAMVNSDHSKPNQKEIRMWYIRNSDQSQVYSLQSDADMAGIVDGETLFVDQKPKGSKYEDLEMPLTIRTP